MKSSITSNTFENRTIKGNKLRAFLQASEDLLPISYKLILRLSERLNISPDHLVLFIEIAKAGGLRNEN
jgi:hypothetical protein